MSKNTFINEFSGIDHNKIRKALANYFKGKRLITNKGIFHVDSFMQLVQIT